MRWAVDRDASIVASEDANSLRPFGTIELPIKILWWRLTDYQVGLKIIASIQRSLDRGLIDIEDVWEVMTDTLRIIRHSSCSTHIHIDFLRGWSLNNLKQLAKGWLCLERRIVEALPEHRRNGILAAPNHLCRSNDESSKLCDLYAQDQTNNFASTFPFVDEASSTEELIMRAAPERLPTSMEPEKHQHLRYSGISETSSVAQRRGYHTLGRNDGWNCQMVSRGWFRGWAYPKTSRDSDIHLSAPSCNCFYCRTPNMKNYLDHWYSLRHRILGYLPLVPREMKLGRLPVEKEGVLRPPEAPTGSQPQSGGN